MRIPKAWVPILAKRIAENLAAKELVGIKVAMEKFVEKTEEIIAEELSLEDRLNEEVRELLKKHATDIERGRMDYRRLFELTKQKLVKERNLVL
ncbi:MAG: DUF507 family protein [Nitrospiraceae bacterium]|nr:DUF507 family protein [Nitrospiraceae bacterium]